jgi:hypothetical protein
MAKSSGVCKLTGKTGKFVNCNIIPRALTYSTGNDHAGSDARFVEIGKGERPTKAHTSWYDPCLVTQDGEDILSRIDTQGIEILRKSNLVDSRTGQAVEGKEIRVHLTANELASLESFFNSVLWRAAESHLKQFKEIVLFNDFLEALRRSILGEQELPRDAFVKSFMRLTEIAEKFNTSPVFVRNGICVIRNSMYCSFDCFVFYMCGLYVYFGTVNQNPLHFEGKKNKHWDSRRTW